MIFKQIVIGRQAGMNATEIAIEKTTESGKKIKKCERRSKKDATINAIKIGKKRQKSERYKRECNTEKNAIDRIWVQLEI